MQDTLDTLDILVVNFSERLQEIEVVFILQPFFGKSIRNADRYYPIIDIEDAGVLEPGKKIRTGNREFHFPEHGFPEVFVCHREYKGMKYR